MNFNLIINIITLILCLLFSLALVRVSIFNSAALLLTTEVRLAMVRAYQHDHLMMAIWSLFVICDIYTIVGKEKIDTYFGDGVIHALRNLLFQKTIPSKSKKVKK